MARKAPFRERMTRRAAIAGGRLRRSAPGGAPRHRSVFLHMPKCGGTSVSEAMYATVPLNQRIGVIDAISTRRAAAMMRFGEDSETLCHEDQENGQSTFDLREALLLQHMAWDTMLIHGHVFWSERAERLFGETYRYVTLMRDPVARTLSNYRMARRTGAAAEDLDAWLETPMARRQARVYLRYLTGANDTPDAGLPAALALAKARLAKIALVGFLDDLDGFARDYRALFGTGLRMARLNRAPDAAPDLTPEQESRLRALCAPDLDLWHQARTMGARKMEARTAKAELETNVR